MIPKAFSINVILQLCNAVVACLILIGVIQGDITDHPYIDWITMVLGLVLCLQTHIALRFERRNPDPFVLVMAYLLTFFYALRIYTLSLYPFQPVFERFTYYPSDSNYALLYILVANIFLYAGFFRLKSQGDGKIDTGKYIPRRPRAGVILFILSLLFALFIKDLLPVSIAPLFSLIFDNFLTPNMILMILAAYVVVFIDQLPPRYVKLVLVGASILLVLQTLAFSRSGMLTLVGNVLIVVLAIYPSLKLRRNIVFIGILFIPFLLSAAFYFYAVSTTTRMTKGEAGTTLSERVELLESSRTTLIRDSRIEFFVGQALARAGYFDYSAELIANSGNYAGTFTARNYLRSVVDNVLTPGFNVFDQPRLSNSLKYAINTFGSPSIATESLGAYHTDQFGLYGEMYNLFGYASLPLLYFCAYFLKLAFRCKGNFNPRIIALNRVLIIWIFYQWMNSFGLDWIAFNVLVAIASFYGISKLFFLTIKPTSNEGRLHLGNNKYV